MGVCKMRPRARIYSNFFLRLRVLDPAVTQILPENALGYAICRTEKTPVFSGEEA